MSRYRNFRELREKLEATPGHPERAARAREVHQAEVHAYRLAELRRLRESTQAELAESAGLVQPAVSRLERDADPNVTLRTLRRYVEGLGGHLELAAVFDDGERLVLDLPDRPTASDAAPGFANDGSGYERKARKRG